MSRSDDKREEEQYCMEVVAYWIYKADRLEKENIDLKDRVADLSDLVHRLKYDPPSRIST